MESPLAHGPTLAATSAQGAGGERLAEGTTVGDYKIERFLGAGAMGEVYAAKHPVIGKRVAIKVLKRELAADPEAAERFVREARAVNQVDHPNVIDVFTIGRIADSRLFLAMDLVSGRSLRKVLEDGPLAVDTALAVLDQIASALDAAHAKGVVHRDLKPDNVMLADGEPPKVYVLDFGIAKLVAEGQTGGTLTGKGAWLGTPGYMAPEQWSADGAGPASDRYALGVMAFELLSGALPFKASTLPQMMEQHFRAPVPALTTKRGKVAHSATIDPVLARAMAKSPDARFASAKELVAALREAAGGKRVIARRVPIVPAVAGAGVLAIALGGYAVVRGGAKSDDDSRERRDQPADQPALPPSDTVTLEVTSVPKGAKVMLDDNYVGPTPAKVITKPGTKLAMTLSKPGYRTKTVDLVASARPVALQLDEVRDFEGVWRMDDQQLRGFKRVGESVEVYKHASVRGDGDFWRKFTFVEPPAGMTSVVFATDVELALGGRPEPSCQVKHRVEYRFDPVNEHFEVRAEEVDWKPAGVGCTVVEVKPGSPILLARADRGSGDTRTSRPPVGVPVDKKRPPNRKEAPARESKEAQLEAKRRAEQANIEQANKDAARNNPVQTGGAQENQAPVPQVQTKGPRPGDSQQANPPQQAPLPEAK
jgi:tRNA A-37 threonylcarbamoyl transferase component Bud32